MSEQLTEAERAKVEEFIENSCREIKDLPYEIKFMLIVSVVFGCIPTFPDDKSRDELRAAINGAFDKYKEFAKIYLSNKAEGAVH